MDSSLFAKLEDGTGYNSIYQNNVLNPYVNFHRSNNEKALYDSLVSESIQMRGVEAIYIRREHQKLDLVFGEDPLSKFVKNYKISIYIESFQGWEGDLDWMTKFGFMIRDEMSFTINPNLFSTQADGEVMKEGDLLYLPMAKSLFEIAWVKTEDPWYGVGSIPICRIKANKFVYSGEEIALEKTQSVEDPIIDLFSVDDLEPVNNLNGRWDTVVDQGNEVEQVHEEAAKFTQGASVHPTGGPLRPTMIQRNVSVNLDSPLDF